MIAKVKPHLFFCFVNFFHESVFLDGNSTILKIATVAPNRLSFSRKAVSVVEMAHGTAERIRLGVGQQFGPRAGELDGW